MTVLLKKINIISFGQFENTSINFEDGFNLIYGKNELLKEFCMVLMMETVSVILIKSRKSIGL